MGTSNEIITRRAGLEDLDELAPLFTAYRVFYGQPANPKADRQFLERRIANDESVVILAERDRRAVGFTQLYPTFSSVSLKQDWILNDLYVAEGARRLGVAAALLEAAHEFGRRTGARSLMLETTPENAPAQRLYEKLGWLRDDHLHYSIEC